jgi:hypothetical protein
VSDFAALLVAALTGALAVATFWLAWETRTARIQGERKARRRLLRAALAEQLDNCRALNWREPARGKPAWVGLAKTTPRTDAVASLIGSLDIPADLFAYLVWLQAAIDDAWSRVTAALHAILDRPGHAPTTGEINELEAAWQVALERVQVLAGLVSAEARREGFDDVGVAHDAAPWTIVPQRPPTWRLNMAIADGPYFGAPPFPADPSFASVSPAVRDRAGDATGTRQQSWLLGAPDQGA